VTDPVDRIVAQWRAVRPDLDVSPMAVIGRLSRASLLVDAELRRTFERHGLDRASFDVLATLRRSGGVLAPGALTRSTMVTSGAITQRLDRLEARGLVTRARNAADGRGVHVRLTDAGCALIDAALPDHVATEHRLLASLTDGQRAALIDALRTLLAGLGDGAVPPDTAPPDTVLPDTAPPDTVLPDTALRGTTPLPTARPPAAGREPSPVATGLQAPGPRRNSRTAPASSTR
jgi:DNA-binding MarR family transcriptional regulator